jgi:hypothetical protein
MADHWVLAVTVATLTGALLVSYRATRSYRRDGHVERSTQMLVLGIYFLAAAAAGTMTARTVVEGPVPEIVDYGLGGIGLVGLGTVAFVAAAEIRRFVRG